jgi:hypothetical protein
METNVRPADLRRKSPHSSGTFFSTQGKKQNDNFKPSRYIVKFAFHGTGRSSSAVEQRIRNARVAGSIPAFGSIPGKKAMTNRPVQSRTSRMRRREAVLNGLSKLVGCTALVVTVAVVFYVAVTQLDKEGPRIDPSYIEEASSPLADYRWSGSDSQPKDARLNLARPVSPPAPQPSTLAEPSGNQSATTDPGINGMEQKRPRIEAVVRRFFAASTIAEKAACSRDSERVRSLMEVYYQKHTLNSEPWQGIGWILPMDEPGHRLAYAQTLFIGADPVCVIIEESDDGDFLVDWESSVRYSEIDWKDFLSKRPDQPTLFRVIASKPGITSGLIASGEQEVIELKHPAEQGTVYAYFNRDDPQFRSLLEQLKLGNWTNVPLTLRLCYPGPTANAQAVRITSVEGKGWIILQHRRS